MAKFFINGFISRLFTKMGWFDSDKESDDKTLHSILVTLDKEEMQEKLNNMEDDDYYEKH
jgi:hypothetical protein